MIDPMVDVMGAVGDRTGVSGFYISFVLAPLASNASELIAAFNYSLKKTSRTIVISFAALQVTSDYLLPIDQIDVFPGTDVYSIQEGSR